MFIYVLCMCWVLNVPEQHSAFSLGPTAACPSSVWLPHRWHWGSGIWGWWGHTLGSGSSSRRRGCSPQASLTDGWIMNHQWVCVHSCVMYTISLFYLIKCKCLKAKASQKQSECRHNLTHIKGIQLVCFHSASKQKSTLTPVAATFSSPSSMFPAPDRSWRSRPLRCCLGTEVWECRALPWCSPRPRCQWVSCRSWI